MRDHKLFYIDGQWVPPVNGGEPFDVVNPATEAVAGVIHLGDEADVERAIAAARRAFDGWSTTPLKTRSDLLARIAVIYERRIDEMAAAISEEMGAPLAKVARAAQAPLGLWQLQTTLALAADYPFEKRLGNTHLVKEAVGVCALITPWNWPMNQVLCKVAPALLAGCTMVLKPSEYAPFSAQVLAEILHEAGVPAGVFNLIHGDGARLGPLLSSHPEVDMVSLTGSTRAGSSVARHAADTIKVVSLELGGKSANIILADAPLEEAVAAATVQRLIVGDPLDHATTTGPIANRRQYERVQALIAQGIEEGATLVAGGLGRPEGITRGWFARATIFSGVHNQMTIAREEIFGPVLALIPYDDEDDAVAIANDSDYGLSGYVWGGTVARAAAVAKRLRTGMVHLNGAGIDLAAPFGGYKRSGNGREWGAAGIDEFLETKALMGAGA